MIFEFKVTDGGKLYCMNKKNAYIIGKTSNHDKAHFVFEDSWKDLRITVTFYLLGDEKNAVTKTLDSDNTCFIPWEAITSKGYLIVACKGEKGNEVAKTKMESTLIVKSPDVTEGSNAKEPAPSIVEVINARIDKCVPKEELEKMVNSIELDNYYMKSESDAKYLTEHQSLADYYTKQQSDDKYLTEHQSLDNYYTKQQSDAKYITEHQSLADYYTKQQSDAKYITEHQSLDNYYTKQQSDDKYITEHQSLADYYTKEAADNRYYTKDQADSKYLTSHQSLAEYAKTVDVNNSLDTKLSKEDYRKKYALIYKSDTGYNPKIEDAVDDESVSINIKGRTYQNLISGKTISFTCDSALTDYTKVSEDNHLKVNINTNVTDSWRYCSIPINLTLIRPNAIYTFVCDKLTGVQNIEIKKSDGSNIISTQETVNGETVIKIITLTDSDTFFSTLGSQVLYLTVSNSTTEIEIVNPRLFEGDYSTMTSDKFPAPFEGIKSVGSTSTIKVISYGENVINVEDQISVFYNSASSIGSCSQTVIARDIDISKYTGKYYVGCTLSVNYKTTTAKVILSKTKYTGGIVGGTYRTDASHTNLYSVLIAGGNGQENNCNNCMDLTDYNYMYITTGNVSVSANAYCRVSYKNIYMIKSETTVPYSPYHYSEASIPISELRSIPQAGVYDEIKGNKLIRRVGVITFDGSADESWSATGYGGSPTQNTFEYYGEFCNEEIKVNSSATQIKCYCNLFGQDLVTGIPVNGRYRLSYNPGMIKQNGKAGMFALFSPTTNIVPYRNVAAWRQYLAQNPVTVYYYSYSEEELTPEQIQIYKDLTYVSVSDDVPAEIQVEYVADHNKVMTDIASQFVDLQEQIDEMSISS